MIHDHDMPSYLWEETCSTIVYTYKKSPHKMLVKMTLEEDFIGKKLDLSHFNIFGSLIYFHIPGDTHVLSKILL